MTSTDNPIESMRVHRRFTLSAGSGLLGDPSGMWTTYRHLEERVVAERAACADLVRAAGCICDSLVDTGAEPEFAFMEPGEDGSLGRMRFARKHDPRCPQAIAAAIEARK